MASKAELGKYPMIISINKRIPNYLSYLQDKGDNSIVKQSLQISLKLYKSGQNSSSLLRSRLLDVTQRSPLWGERCVTSKRRLRRRLK